MEIEREQGVKLMFVDIVGMSQTIRDGQLEGSEIRVVDGVKTLFLHELPEPLNEI